MLTLILNGGIDIKILSFLFLYVCVITSVSGETMDKEYYEKKVAKNLMLSALWLVESGYSTFKRNGKEYFDDKLIDTWSVQSWIEPSLDEDGDIAVFRIKARGINYDIHCLLREKTNNVIYEYWLMKIYAKPWSGSNDKSVFLITKGKEIAGVREIIKKSEYFFSTYQIDEKNILALPVENLQLLYTMEAWNFPENYKDSSINKQRVVIDENGKFLFIP